MAFDIAHYEGLNDGFDCSSANEPMAQTQGARARQLDHPFQAPPVLAGVHDGQLALEFQAAATGQQTGGGQLRKARNRRVRRAGLGQQIRTQIRPNPLTNRAGTRSYAYWLQRAQRCGLSNLDSSAYQPAPQNRRRRQAIER